MLKIYRRILNLFLIVFIILPISSTIVAIQGMGDDRDIYSNNEIETINSLSNLKNETVAMILVLDKTLSQQEVANIFNNLKNTYFDFHGIRVPITVGEEPLKMDNLGYIIRLYGPADLLKSKISDIGLSRVSKAMAKSLPLAQPRELRELKDVENFTQEKINLTTNDVRVLIGASIVESKYRLTGSGVKIAIVDTGVDYAHPDLRSKLSYYVGDYRSVDRSIIRVREPLILDADESHVVLLKGFTANATGYIDVSRSYFITLIPWPYWLYPPHSAYYVGKFSSASGVYKFGVTLIISYVVGIISVGVLMVDPVTPGNYTLLVIDANDDGVFGDAGDIIVTYDGDRILYSPELDLSFGVAGGFFFDWWWWFGYPGWVYPGWDLKGRYISIFYDFYGHGTACASAAAGNGLVNGIARDANIVGVKALWIGNVELGMLWAAGFDIDNKGYIYYTGSKRVDIISNSWGISTFIYDIAGFGYDYMSTFINALTTPGFLDPVFPGVLVVQAAGNGGPGFGTVTSPGAAVGALTVGASTLWKIFKDRYGYGGYTQDNVITWSARGPVPMGYLKPDLVNVGAWGVTAYPIPVYYIIFGGTSYATPLTAGAAALVIQALRTKLGSSADSLPPSYIKQILMLTADDLGYAPYEQGAGRVNALRAVELALGVSRELIITSTTQYNETYKKLSSIWYWYFKDYIPLVFLFWYGPDLKIVNPAMPTTFATQGHYGVYVPDVPYSGSKNFDFTIYNPTTQIATISIDGVYTLRQILSPTSYTLRFNSTYPQRISEQWIVLRSTDISPSTKLLLVEVNTSYGLLDPYYIYYLPDFTVFVYAYVWINDTNSNGRPDRDELAFINVGYATSNYNLVEISNPRQLLSQFGPNARLALRVILYRYYSWRNLVNYPVTLTISQYTLVRDPSVVVPSMSLTLLPGKSTRLIGSITASYLAPTTYQSIILVRASFSDGTQRTYYVPLTYTVYMDLIDRQLILNPATDLSSLLSSSHLRGAIDWDWRYESGDWRFFYVNVLSPYIAAFELKAMWTNTNTSLITYTLGPDGQFAGVFYGESVSYHRRLYGGAFLWVATGGVAGKNQSVITFPSTRYRYFLYPTMKPNKGIYTLIVRTGLFDGSSNLERFYMFVKPLSIKGLPDKPMGSSGSATYTITTPYAADYYIAFATRWHYLPFFTYCYAYTNVYPSSYSGYISAGTTLTFNLTFNNYYYPYRCDISLLVSFRMRDPVNGLPVYYRFFGRTGIYSYYYVFEDWIISGTDWYWWYWR